MRVDQALRALKMQREGIFREMQCAALREARRGRGDTARRRRKPARLCAWHESKVAWQLRRYFDVFGCMCGGRESFAITSPLVCEENRSAKPI
jgi:ribosomal protein S21